MTRPWLSSAIVAAALSAAVAGCGGSTPTVPGPASTAPGTAAGQRVTAGGTNSLRFTPMTVHVHAGPVRIALKDMGAHPHNLVIPACV